jgi:hypothetical protein
VVLERLEIELAEGGRALKKMTFLKGCISE